MSSTNGPDIVKSSLELTYPLYTLFCVIISSLGFFCSGWVTASANLPGTITHICDNGLSHIANTSFPDCLPMNDALWGFAVASFCIGALLGGLNGGYLQTKYGRRKIIVWNTFGYILGGLLIGCSVSPAMFIVGRIMCGYSCGLGSLTIPIYVGEISTVKSRGVLASINQLMTTIGILLASIIGLPLSYVSLWRINYALVAVPALVQAGFMTSLCAESPRYLISIGKVDEAMKNLKKLRPNSNVDLEFYGMLDGQLGTAAAVAIMADFTSVEYFEKNNTDIEHVVSDLLQHTAQVSRGTADIYSISTSKYDNSSDSDPKDGDGKNAILAAVDPMNIIQIFRNSTIRPITMIVVLHHVFQQLIGINAIMYYSTTLFSIVFDPNMSKYLAIICNAVNFIATIVSIVLIDRAGRRSLLLVSEAGSCVFCITLTIGYVYEVNPLMVVSIFGYVIFFAIGLGPVPWVIIPELSPVYASSSVGSIATAANWSMNFLIGQCFPLIFARIEGYTFIIFVVVGFLSLMFTYFKLPETKGRTIEDIVSRFIKA
ncbi:MAG: major facilitator superfamily domain-containing protein [Benjaminiella poitrasii]|nr:MAG: major facilitator superfamily domain-containing protein [Benjaminiella poitrasii]